VLVYLDPAAALRRSQRRVRHRQTRDTILAIGEGLSAAANATDEVVQLHSKRIATARLVPAITFSPSTVKNFLLPTTPKSFGTIESL